MNTSDSRSSLRCRVSRMSTAWLVVGALVGLIGSGSAQTAQTAAGMLAAMIVLAIPGLVLGLIGADVTGTYVGAAGGLLGSWLSWLKDGVAVPAPEVNLMVVFGALAGATCVLYLRIVRQAVGTLSGRACQLIAFAAAPARELHRSDRLVPAKRSRTIWVPRAVPWSATRLRPPGPTSRHRCG
jgi:hypothetical protein